MSVIGRLDEQVEAVLINPLKRKDDEEERDAPSPTPAPQQAELEAEPSEQQTRETDAALPVWLL